jgi:hypothetical protein
MERSLRQIDPAVHLINEVTPGAMASIDSYKEILKVLEPIGISESRVRKLTMVTVVLVCIAMNLFTEEAIEDVLAKLMQDPRLLRPGNDIVTASKSAICQRRRQLGIAPMARLFHQVCQPMATPDTPGAYLLRILRRAVFEFQIIDHGQCLWLWKGLLNDIVQANLAARDNRSNPRVIWRKMSNFCQK